jgi:glutathione S-transferase
MYRPLIRGFASYWTDLPIFRVATGLIPAPVWRSHFGTDRANLIGHPLDTQKLEKKFPQNLSGLDLHLSLLEPLFVDPKKPWIFEGDQPSAADIAAFYMLDWGEKIARGEGVNNLTGGAVREGEGEGAKSVLNLERYPGLSAWFERFRSHIESVPSKEMRVERADDKGLQNVLDTLKKATLSDEVPILPTPSGPHADLDKRNGLVRGAEVNIAPDDTGRDSPTIGTLLAATPEEVVIRPRVVNEVGGSTVGEVRIHFPRVKFVIRPVGQAHL